MDKTELFVPIVKKQTKIDGVKETKFFGILSDDSLDRDDEMMSSDLIKSWANNGSIPGLINHKNEVSSYVADFTNLRVLEQDGMTALAGDITFLPVPEAETVKQRIIHGNHMGLSISAITHNFEMVNKMVNGVEKKVKQFTEGELLEGSFIPVQSNRHGKAIAIAKSFDLNNKKEVGITMPEEKKVETEVFDIKKAFEELKADFESKIESVNKSLKEEIQKFKEEELKVKVEEKSADVESEKKEEEKVENDAESDVEKSKELKKGLESNAKVEEKLIELNLSNIVNKFYGGNE